VRTGRRPAVPHFDAPFSSRLSTPCGDDYHAPCDTRGGDRAPQANPFRRTANLWNSRRSFASTLRPSRNCGRRAKSIWSGTRRGLLTLFDPKTCVVSEPGTRRAQLWTSLMPISCSQSVPHYRTESQRRFRRISVGSLGRPTLIATAAPRSAFTPGDHSYGPVIRCNHIGKRHAVPTTGTSLLCNRLFEPRCIATPVAEASGGFFPVVKNA
jgi:hypothetical protein